jgi:hypothetical protein
MGVFLLNLSSTVKRDTNAEVYLAGSRIAAPRAGLLAFAPE